MPKEETIGLKNPVEWFCFVSILFSSSCTINMNFALFYHFPVQARYAFVIMMTCHDQDVYDDDNKETKQFFNCLVL